MVIEKSRAVAVEKLRDEMRDLKVAIRDLLKWKLVLTGSVTAVGLGLTGPSNPNAYLAISAVPLIAAYCDLLIRDHELRVAIQAAYIRTNGDSEYSKYEIFLEEQEIKDTAWWTLRRNGMLLSSLIVCVFIALIGGFQQGFQDSSLGLFRLLPLVTAFVGTVAVIFIQILYAAKRQSISKATKKVHPSLLLYK